MKTYKLILWHNKHLWISEGEVAWIEGIRNNSLFHMKNGKKYLQTNTPLCNILPLFPSFIRIHKGYLISKEYLPKELKRKVPIKIEIEGIISIKLDVSRRKYYELRQSLKIRA